MDVSVTSKGLDKSNFTVLEGDEDYAMTSHIILNIPRKSIHTSPFENRAKVTMKYFRGSRTLSSPTK